MPVKIDHKDPAFRDATHLAQNLNDLLVNKVMREERADHIVKRRSLQMEAVAHRHALN